MGAEAGERCRLDPVGRPGCDKRTPLALASGLVGSVTKVGRGRGAFCIFTEEANAFSEFCFSGCIGPVVEDAPAIGKEIPLAKLALSFTPNAHLAKFQRPSLIFGRS